MCITRTFLEGGKGVANGKVKGKKVEEKREDCGECNKEIKSQEQGVTCDLCEVCFHMTSAAVSHRHNIYA